MQAAILLGLSEELNSNLSFSKQTNRHKKSILRYLFILSG